MKRIFAAIFLAAFALAAAAQFPKVYDESIDPIAQIDSAAAAAREQGKYVIAQAGGNWCPWCLRLAQYVKDDAEIARFIDDNFVYIHVDYPRNPSPELKARLKNAGRFGFPVLVVLGPDGQVMHIQDSGLLESGESYDREKLARFLQLWSPGQAQE